MHENYSENYGNIFCFLLFVLLILYEVEILDCSEIATDLLPRQPPDDKTKRWLQASRQKGMARERD